ncbi:MAG: GNAT family N-acetyltransferase [Alphaproteobacteria bacterium]|nr:GNAT family N-acetyltransferase [Alphaproteobacteria bacterium]
MKEATIRWSWDHEQAAPFDLKMLYSEAGFGFAERLGLDDVAKLFNPGAFGLFAFLGDRLVGAARVLSDELLVSWLAEICVHPSWRGRAIGRGFLERIDERFGKTALYCDAPAEHVDFFKKGGIRPRVKLNVCRRLPCEGTILPQESSQAVITDDAFKYSAAQFDQVVDSVGFGITEKGMSREKLYERLFGEGAFGAFAENAEGQLIGFARVFSDCFSKCYLTEICVHPDWQRRGVGRALVRRIVSRFSRTTIYTEAFPNALPLLRTHGVLPATDLVGCSRAPLTEQEAISNAVGGRGP